MSVWLIVAGKSVKDSSGATVSGVNAAPLAGSADRTVRLTDYRPVSALSTKMSVWDLPGIAGNERPNCSGHKMSVEVGSVRRRIGRV